MFGPQGWTDKVVEYLRKKKIKIEKSADPTVLYCNVSSKELKELSKLIPPKNMSFRRNYSPRFKDYLNFAEKCPKAEFMIYVVRKPREDERVGIEGVIFPKSYVGDAEKLLLAKAEDHPDDVGETDGYVYYWWD